MKRIKSLFNKTSLLAVLIIFSCQPEEITYFVNVNSSSNGSVNKNMQEVSEGSTVTLTATPSQGYEFVEWSSSDGQKYTQNPLTITVNNDIFLSPVFRAIKYELTINKIGSGSVAQELVLGELQGLGTYTAGSQVDLIASPNSNYAFYNWNSVITDTASVKRVTMDQSKEVTAYFDYEVAKQLVGTWEFQIEEPNTGKDPSSEKSFYTIRLTIDYGFNCLFSSFRGGIRRSYRSRIRPLSRTSCSIGGFGLLSGISFNSSSRLSCSFSTPASPVQEITTSTEMEKSIEVSANKIEDESLDKDENGLISENQSEIDLLENQEEAAK